jgi:L-arabinose isomerase
MIDTSLDSLCRHEIVTNLNRLRGLRELQAAGLGLLVSEGMEFEGANGDWKQHVVRGVDVMKSLMEWLQNIDVEADSVAQVEEGNCEFSFHNC